MLKRAQEFAFIILIKCSANDVLQLAECVKSFPQIEEIQAVKMKSKGIAISNGLATCVPKLKKLQTIKLHDCGPLNVSNLAVAIQNHPTLKTFDVKGCKLRNGLGDLIKALASCPELETVDVSSTLFGNDDLGCNDFLRGFVNIKKLKVLDMTFCYLKSDQLTVLASEVLPQIKNGLTHFGLNSNSIKDPAILAKIVNALENAPLLEEFKIGDVVMENMFTDNLVETLKTMKALKSLRVSECSVEKLKSALGANIVAKYY